MPVEQKSLNFVKAFPSTMVQLQKLRIFAAHDNNYMTNFCI